MTEPMERLRTALADRYALDREIGRGGMATVYLAEDRKHRRKVAVKVLRPDLAATIGAERFLREIEIAAKLEHPHILTLIDSGEAAGFLYYVMPYIEGESLRAKLAREGELPITEAVRLIREVVDALAYAHRYGLVHRDIKPDNVLLSGGHAVVTDFGVAKAVSEATGRQQITTAGMALGTPAYMAPEQAAADPHVDHRADIYAVGCTAYEVLTGRQPFTGSSPQQVLSAHVTRAPEPVTTHRHTVPAPLAQLVMRCLEKNPADRWQSAAEMLPVLDVAATTSAGVTPTATQPVRGARAPSVFGQRAVVAGVAAVIVLGGAYLLFRSDAPAGRAGDGQSIAVLPFTSVGNDAESVSFAAGLHDDLLTQLTKIGALRVTSRTSVLEYQHTTKNVREIGDELQVATVLEGSVRRAGNRVRLNAQLIDTRTDEHLWAETYDRELSVENIFAIQGEIAREITQALQAEFTEVESARIAVIPTQNVEAYDAYLRGRQVRGSVSRDVLEQAIREFERAVELDPDFGAAFAGLAYVHLVHFWFNGQPEHLPLARAALDRAIARAPEHPETHLAQGFYHYYGLLDYEPALEHFLMARGLQPNDADIQNAVGLIRKRQGNLDAAVADQERAVALDPRAFSPRWELGELFRVLGRLDEAELHLHRAMSIGPQRSPGYSVLFEVKLWERGDTLAARAVLDRIPDSLANDLRPRLAATLAWYARDFQEALRILREGDPDNYEFIGTLSLRLGQRAQARAYGDSLRMANDSILREIDRPGPINRRTVGQVRARLGLAYAFLGDSARAVAEGERALAVYSMERDHWNGNTTHAVLARIYLLVGDTQSALDQLDLLRTEPNPYTSAQRLSTDPTYDGIRELPRFRALVAGRD